MTFRGGIHNTALAIPISPRSSIIDVQGARNESIVSSNNSHYGTLSTVEVERNGKDKRSVIYSPCYRPDTGNRKGVFVLEMLVSFLIAVAAGVACHYIIKWLDGDK